MRVSSNIENILPVVLFTAFVCGWCAVKPVYAVASSQADTPAVCFVDDYCNSTINETPDPAVIPPEDVGIVDVPITESTDKELPVSESMPDWLLQIEKEIAAALAASNTVTPPTTPIVVTPRVARPITTPNNDQAADPQTATVTPVNDPSNTQVAGVSSAVETLPIEQESVFSSWLLLPVLLMVILIGIVWRRYARARS